jgi:adenylate cyclase
MLHFAITTKGQHRQFDHPGGPIEFGRGPKRDQVPRPVILEDSFVSRDHLRVEETPDGLVQLRNLSQRNPVWLGDNTMLPPGGDRTMPLPVRLSVGESIIVIEAPPPPIPSESWATIARPVAASRSIGDAVPSLMKLGESPDPATLARWFETLIAVQRAAAGSPEFYSQTAQALVDLVGLDRGLVLLRHCDDWEVVARSAKDQESGRDFSHTILQQLVKEKRTLYQSATAASNIVSLTGVEAVVASPILDAEEEVVGALYGSRGQLASSQVFGIGPLEAQVVQLLASSAGVGLARLEQEATASRLRVQFEQFFSTNLARELQCNPRLLEGQEREVTILFSDIRGFSALAERLGAQDTCVLVREVMEQITEEVRRFDGVVVDYSGDGMMAMWNAPASQPDHAVLACRAALAILAGLPKLSEAWSARLGRPLAVGLGLNTGPALVGNTGSRHKFKYGPLGHTVNLASRVEGATKHLGVPVVITGSTHALVGERFATRKLCRARLEGMTDPADLYELHAEEVQPDWLTRRDGYEQSLDLYMAGQWPACCRTLLPLLPAVEGQYDIPSLSLATRALECLKSPPKTFDPIWDLGGK